MLFRNKLFVQNILDNFSLGEGAGCSVSHPQAEIRGFVISNLEGKMLKTAEKKYNICLFHRRKSLFEKMVSYEQFIPPSLDTIQLIPPYKLCLLKLFFDPLKLTLNKRQDRL